MMHDVRNNVECMFKHRYLIRHFPLQLLSPYDASITLKYAGEFWM